MEIEKVKNRGVLFTFHQDSEWDLNIYLIRGKQYNYVIDTGLGSLSAAPVREYIKNDGKSTIVINTHYHWDHIWGNHLFRDCIILSHRLCKEAIELQWDAMLGKNAQYIKGETAKCLPSLVFDGTLYFPEDKIRILYTPGHTIDSISVLDEEEKVLHAGDNIGDNMDEIVPGISCGNEQYTATLSKYEEMDFDTCVSGHNVVLGKEVVSSIRYKLIARRI